MSSPNPLHRLATQHFDGTYKWKQSESFLSQPEHTIWVSRHRTLRTQYLHLGACTLHASEILIFKILINACKQTGEMLIDWSFFRGV